MILKSRKNMGILVCEQLRSGLYERIGKNEEASESEISAV
jgi:hypothetical protein